MCYCRHYYFKCRIWTSRTQNPWQIYLDSCYSTFGSLPRSISITWELVSNAVLAPVLGRLHQNLHLPRAQVNTLKVVKRSCRAHRGPHAETRPETGLFWGRRPRGVRLPCLGLPIAWKALRPLSERAFYVGTWPGSLHVGVLGRPGAWGHPPPPPGVQEML